MAESHFDPYKNLWDEDTESVAKDWNQNSTLFAPSFEDMGHRMVSKAKYHLRIARKLKGTPDAEVEFENALIYRRIAKTMFARHQDVLAKSR